MIETEVLQTKVNEYQNECRKRQTKPTYNGLGHWLGISNKTVSHICTGLYKGNRRYTDTPHITRCIDNMDFRIIQDLFD